MTRIPARRIPATWIRPAVATWSRAHAGTLGPVGWLPDAPAVVLVALTLAAALFLVEAALPTFGVAGLSGLVLLTVGLLAADDQGRPWWPLLFVAGAVCLWAVLLMTRSSAPTGQATAASLFAIGSLSYGVLAGDPTTIVLAVVGSVALPFGFGPLLGATTRLLDLPAQTGMAALVGRGGTVVDWSGRSGTVRVDGSLWDARCPTELVTGAEVVVTGHEEMTVNVALRAPVP